MARRYSGNMNSEQVLGNVNKKKVHDLDKENTAGNGFQIKEIIAASNDQPLSLLPTAHDEGYDNCAKCIGNSRR